MPRSRRRSDSTSSRRSFRRGCSALAAGALLVTGAGLTSAYGAVSPPAGDVPRPTESDYHVLVSEMTNGGPAGDSDDFFEVRNFGDEPVDISAWSLFHCSSKGNRFKEPYVVVSDGTVLEPGEIYAAASQTALAGFDVDARYDTPASNAGFGVYIEDEHRNRIDSMAVHPQQPWPTTSDCSNGANLTNTLNYITGESWQRVTATGDSSADWVMAPRTPTAQNATETVPSFTHRGEIFINEIASGSSHHAGDDFIELRNYGQQPVDISGWQLYKCSTTGIILDSYLQTTIEAGTILEPGEMFTAGHRLRFSGGFGDEEGQAQAELASVYASTGTFGGAVMDENGDFVDGVFVSSTNTDGACQIGATKLAHQADLGADESFQRVGTTGDLDADWVIAGRTANGANATEENSIAAEARQERGRDGVRVSEIATDPDELPEGVRQQNYFELGNYSSAPVDISEWTVRACLPDGRRSLDALFTVDPGTELAPGEVFLAAQSGTAAAELAGATYTGSLALVGTGLWIEDADGSLVDNVSILSRNAGDSVNDPYSPCTQGRSLTTYLPDRIAGETYLRSQFTGSNHTDFVVATGTPGAIDEAEWVDPTEPVPGSTDPVTVPTSHRSDTPLGSSTRTGDGDALTATVHDRDDDLLDVAVRGGRSIPLTDLLTTSYTGVSEAAPLPGPTGNGEVAHPAGASPEGLAVTDTGHGYPYQRFELATGTAEATLAAGDEIVWSGSTSGRNELQLYLWDPTESVWRLADAAVPSEQGVITLTVALRAGDLEADAINVLVQNGPRTAPTLAETFEEFQNPGEFNFSLVHMTDSQYLVESYPAAYTAMMSWTLANRDARQIDFVVNTGDIIQNYQRAETNTDRAIDEFVTGSRIHAILDEAQMPNSVLPGNHDNLNGRNSDLYNEYFGPDRYADTPWFLGSREPDRTDANATTFQADGAAFVVISLAYGYNQADLDWAEEVIHAHPDSNIIIAAHEHVMPASRATDPPIEARRADFDAGRWLSRGDVLWDTIVAPNPNVTMVLSGHRNGVGTIVTEDAGGIPGHTVVEMVADYQQFHTERGARDTALLRLLQVDLNGEAMAINTYSPTEDVHHGHHFDYPSPVTDVDDGPEVPNNERPWNLLADGQQGRYIAEDDEFIVPMRLQYEKSVRTAALQVAAQPTQIVATQVDGSGTIDQLWPDSDAAPLTADRVWWVAATDPTGRAVTSAPLLIDAVSDPDPTDDPTEDPADTSPPPPDGGGEDASRPDSPHDAGSPGGDGAMPSTGIALGGLVVLTLIALAAVATGAALRRRARSRG